MASPTFDGAAQQAHAHRQMVIDLGRRLAEQAVAIAEEAGRLNTGGDLPGAWKALGRSVGYTEASRQVLLIATQLTDLGMAVALGAAYGTVLGSADESARKAVHGAFDAQARGTLAEVAAARMTPVGSA